MKNLLLENVQAKITEQYSSLGHDQSWSFLYTPGRTLSREARFLFMGINPGGKWDGTEPQISTEKGNAYNPEVEDWRNNGEGSPLQQQIVKLYVKLASEMAYDDFRMLMDSTLAANFCPFRSRIWDELKNQNASIRFCKELWGYLMNQTQITTILCMSSMVYRHMTSVITSSGGQLICKERPCPVGWGRANYHVSRFKMDGRDVMMLCLPHLSRYQIFSSAKCSEQVGNLIKLLADSLKGWNRRNNSES